MDEAMTDERLAELREQHTRPHQCARGGYYTLDPTYKGNLAVIAECPTLEALAEVDRLRRERDEARAAVARVEALVVRCEENGFDRVWRSTISAALAAPPTSPDSEVPTPSAAGSSMEVAHVVACCDDGKCRCACHPPTQDCWPGHDR